MIASGGTATLGLYDFKAGLDEFGKINYWASQTNGYPINKRVMLTDGTVVQSTTNNNTNNPNTTLVGWVKTNSTSQIFNVNGTSQQELNERSIFLSDYINDLQTFFGSYTKNRVVDVIQITAEDTLTFSGSLDFSNLEIKVNANFNTAKKPIIEFTENAVGENLILNGGGYNVRGARINSSNVTINNLTVRNTQYLGIDGNEAVDKFNVNLSNVTLENVCSAGVSGDLGYGGVSFEQSIGGSFNNITVDGCGAKAFRLRHSKNNTGKKHVYNDVQNDQSAIYLASGENNNIDDVVVTGTRNCIKMSRGEKNSKVTLLNLDNSHISDATYTVAVLLQGTQDCEVNQLTLKKGTGYGIRVEPHPAEAGDAEAEQPSYRNRIKNAVVDAQAGGDLLYSVRSAGLQEMKDNEYENITLKGNDVATSGITLQRSAGTKMSNVNVLDIIGSDLSASDSELNFKDGSLTSNNATSSRKLSFTDASSISIENTKIDGVTSNARYISADLTSGKFQLVNCPDVKTISSDIGLYIVGAGTTANLIANSLKGNRAVVGNNISAGVIANNITEQEISNSSTAVIVSNNFTSSTTNLTLKNQPLPASAGVAAGATINTIFALTGVKLGDIVRVTPIASFNAYDSMSIVGVVSAANTLTIKRKNTTSSPLDMAAISVNIRVDRL